MFIFADVANIFGVGTIDADEGLRNADCCVIVLPERYCVIITCTYTSSAIGRYAGAEKINVKAHCRLCRIG